MDIAETDVVRPADERPARRDGTCFYCTQPIGGQHKDGCVIVAKTVVVKLAMEMEVVVDVPRHWGEDMIHFRFNESSYCTDNMLSKLGRWAEDNEGRCSCSAIEIFYQRDATQEDHEQLPVLVDPVD